MVQNVLEKLKPKPHNHKYKLSKCKTLCTTENIHSTLNQKIKHGGGNIMLWRCLSTETEMQESPNSES